MSESASPPDGPSESRPAKKAARPPAKKAARPRKAAARQTKATSAGSPARSQTRSRTASARAASANAVGLSANAARSAVSAVNSAWSAGRSATGGAEGGRAAAGMTMHVPFASATVRLPGPGAVARLGPVQVTLPTGALYYGGLAALVVGGTLELPVAAGAALAGAVLGRRWLRGAIPKISVFDSRPAPTDAAV